MSKLRAVAFDVDGTLYPYTQVIVKAILFGLTHMRLATSFARVRKIMREVRPIEDFRATQARLFADRTGLAVKDASDWIERKIYNEWLQRFRAVRLYPHAREALEAVRNRGLKCAVMSDFPVKRKLKYLGLAEFPDIAICSEESSYLKPNPEPFYLLARLLGVDPGEILYVGDKYEYDVVGAHHVGMRVAHLTSRPQDGSVADFQFADYKELIHFIHSGIEPGGV